MPTDLEIQNELANFILVDPIRRVMLVRKVIRDLSCCCFTTLQWEQLIAAERANPIPEHGDLLDFVEQLIPHMGAINELLSKFRKESE